MDQGKMPCSPRRFPQFLGITFVAAALAGCADIRVAADASPAARDYAACREKANGIYATVWPFPTVVTHPHRPFSPYTHVSFGNGDDEEDGTLALRKVAHLACFRKEPPPGVEISSRVRRQIEHERKYLKIDEWFRFQDICGDLAKVDECPAFQVRMEVCNDDLGPDCERKLNDPDAARKYRAQLVNATLRVAVMKALRQTGRHPGYGPPPDHPAKMPQYRYLPY